MNNVAPGTRDLDARATRPTPADLAAIKAGTDPLLTTWFLNRGTFTAEQIVFYPYDLRRTYVAELYADECECDAARVAECHCDGVVSDEIRFFATDDLSAMTYLIDGYQGGFPQSAIASVVEIQTTVREVYAG